MIKHQNRINRNRKREDPFKLVREILDMDLETQIEVFPEVGSTENIFKFYTYTEAKNRYDNWRKSNELNTKETS